MLKLPFDVKPCPGECGSECGTALEKCPIYPQLPPDFQQACKDSPHLLQYLRMLPVEKIGIPQYFEKVTRAQKGNKNPNLIYRVGQGVFVHIMANHEDIRNNYIAIEPSFINAEDEALDEVEKRLADHVEELEGMAEPEKRLEIIMDIVDRVVFIDAAKAPVPVAVAVGAGHTGAEAAPEGEADKAKGNGHSGNGHDGKKGGKPLFLKPATVKGSCTLQNSSIRPSNTSCGASWKVWAPSTR